MDKSRFSVAGNPRYTINLLSSAGIRLEKVVKKENELYFSVAANEEDRVERILKQCERVYRKLYRKGWRTKINAGGKRIGLFVGAVLGILIIFLYSGSLTSIQIDGLERVEREQIEAVLLKNGVKTPALFARPDLEMIASEIRSIDGVSDVTVRLIGTKLNVVVLEELESAPREDPNEPIPVVAAYDGVVREIYALRGTPLVEAGASVRKGQILIAPYLEQGEERVPCRAVGSVKAKTYFSKETVYADTALVAEDTGRKTVRTGFSLPFLEWMPKSPYECYRREDRSGQGNCLLPFTFLETVFYEQKFVLKPFDYANKRERLIRENVEALKSELPESREGEKWWIGEKRLDKSTVLSIYYEVIVQIASR